MKIKQLNGSKNNAAIVSPCIVKPENRRNVYEICFLKNIEVFRTENLQISK
jgi:hypothetical protein